MSDTNSDTDREGEEQTTCEIPDCDRPISEVFEAESAQGFPVVAGDIEEHFLMCDHHNAAARVLAYSRPEPPYCDVGLYSEVVYYARQLAAIYFDPDVDLTEIVTPPQEADDDGGEDGVE